MIQAPVTVLPSLPAADWGTLEALLETLKGEAPAFQVDLVDGDFVSPATWPFISDPIDFTALAPYAADYALEVDCMVSEPQQYFDELAAVAIERVIVHWGSVADVTATANAARAYGWQVGLAITNDVALSKVLSVCDQFDYLQVMGIATVGAQGQPFDTRTLTTIAALKVANPHLVVAVDGSVNLETITQLVAAGATRLAPGSAISRAVDPVAAYKQLVTTAAEASAIIES